MAFVEEYGYIGLLLFSFLAATIVPVSSEGAVIGAMALDMHPMKILIWASIGNCLGISLNYAVGYWTAERWLQVETMTDSQRKAYKLVHKYGWLALLLSWLPVVGDPITIFAGASRINIWLFVTLAFSLRILRYYLIVQTVEYW